MSKENVLQRASLLSNQSVFTLKEAIIYLGSDISYETVLALLDRSDFDWVVFFENIEVDVFNKIVYLCEQTFLSKLEAVDVMILIQCAKQKNSEKLWRMVINKKSEIPYMESPSFVSSICEWDEVKNGGVNIFKILIEYYSNLKDSDVVVELVKQIKIKEVKEILLNCDGVLPHIIKLKAKEVVDVGLAFDLKELWNILLLRSDVLLYIRNEMEPEKVYQVVGDYEVFREFSNRGNLEISALIAYAKKTNFKAVWEYIVLNEDNPKTILSFIPDLPHEYLKEDAFNKKSLISYIKTLRYRGIGNILAETNDAKLFDFVLKNMTIKISARNLLVISAKFSHDFYVWHNLLKREDVLQYINSQVALGSASIINLVDKYKSKNLWNHIASIVNFDNAMLIATKLDDELVWESLFRRSDFPRNDVSTLLIIYKSTFSKSIRNKVLSFSSVQKFIEEKK